MATQTSAIYAPANWLDPLDWQSIFDRPRAIEIDIGCGKGAFLLWAAQVQPQHNFVGVERQLVRLRKVDKLVQRLGLQNVRLLRIEAGYLIEKLVPDGSVAAYHIYFPDPWPKRRHHRRRLFAKNFVMSVYRTLRPSGMVNIATDFEEYFTQIGAAMRETGGFAERRPVTLPSEAATEFEREFLKAGKQIFRSRWERS